MHKWCAIVVSRLTIFETENTFRAQRAGGLVTALRDGVLLRRETASRRLYPEAHRLSLFHSRRAAYGAHHDRQLAEDANKASLARESRPAM